MVKGLSIAVALASVTGTEHIGMVQMAVSHVGALEVVEDDLELVSSNQSSKKTGILTMWSTKSALIGSQCEYANSPINSVTDPVLPTQLQTGFHCAIGRPQYS